MQKKRTILLLAATVLAVVLGIIAVVTAYRLRQLATVPIAPNVPSSKPLAATAPVAINGCFGTFTIPSQACGGACNQTADCTGQDSTLQCLNNVCVNPLCPQNKTTCVCPTATPTQTPTPTVTITGTPGPTSTPTLTPKATATPTVPAACNSVCTNNSNCPTDLVCVDSRCRNAACVNESDCTCAVPTATPIPTLTPTSPPQASTPTPTLRAQATPIPTVVPPEMPQAGVAMPTVTAVGLGGFLILAGFALVFLW